MTNRESAIHEKSVITLLRICTVLLAAVSFWSTAQGMQQYTFPSGWQAYAASLGIQGLLLGLDFELSAYLRRITKNFEKAVLWLLTGVILICSSWFSYLYIAKCVYNESWNTQQRLVAQANYREQLFTADAYVEQYQKTVELVLAEEITVLYDQAAAMDDSKIDVNQHLSWAEERERYAPSTSAAQDVMNQAIDAMENATADQAKQAALEQAASILTALQETLQGRIDIVKTRIEAESNNVSSAHENLQQAQNSLRNDPNNSALISANERASQNYNRLLTQLELLEQQESDYQNALQRVDYYLATLGMAQNGSITSFVGEKLSEIHSELFKPEADTERMQSAAAEIFSRLQSGVDFGSSNASSDNAEYYALITQVNRFIQNLERYAGLKDAEQSLKSFTADLAGGKILPLDTDENGSEWQAKWVTQFNDLKSVISSLPILSDDFAANVNSNLSQFDRTSSTKALDRTIEAYLTLHNPAQQGIIYLASPFRGPAIFSVIIAFLLDIAAFITGFIIDHMSSDSGKSASEKQGFLFSPASEAHTYSQPLLRGLNRYIFLTGDYSYLDGIITYRAIENGERTEIDLPNMGKSAGIYLYNKNDTVFVSDSELLYCGEASGPCDGVYRNCTLTYNNGFLIIDLGNGGKSLGTLNPHTPLYQFTLNEFNAASVQNLNEVTAKTAIIALSADGAQIIAVYMQLE